MMALARRRAALVKSLRYLCLMRAPFILCKLLPAPAFMVTLSIFLAGLLVALALLVVKTKPLLSVAAVTPTAFLLTRPLYLWELVLRRLQGSVEKGFFTPRFPM